MTEAQKKLVELEKKKDEVKKFFDDLQAACEAVAKESGVGTMFQDPQGTVYRVVVPEGRYVHFDKLGIERTRRGDEKQGSLSLKAARDAGFVVE